MGLFNKKDQFEMPQDTRKDEGDFIFTIIYQDGSELISYNLKESLRYSIQTIIEKLSRGDFPSATIDIGDGELIILCKELIQHSIVIIEN